MYIAPLGFHLRFLRLGLDPASVLSKLLYLDQHHDASGPGPDNAQQDAAGSLMIMMGSFTCISFTHVCIYP
jgi:hypothetical protein